MDEPKKRTVGESYVRSIIPKRDLRDHDFYPTPAHATEALLAVEKFEGRIWEPACGDGAISKVLEARGYEVISTDLIDRGFGQSRVDFLMEHQSLAPNIVTNPPFKHAIPFLLNSLALTQGKVAFLGRLAWLEGKERRRIFDSSPIARVWVFSERVPMLRNGDPMLKGGGGMIAFAWFVWEHGHTGRPTLGWI